MKFKCLECGNYFKSYGGDGVYCPYCARFVRARKAFPTSLFHKILRFRDFFIYRNIKWEAV